MQVMESFTKMNSGIPREMLRKNNKPSCEVLGILISFQIAHGGFAEEGFRGGGTSQSAKRSRSVTLNKTLRENTEQVAIATVEQSFTKLSQHA